MEYSTLKNYIKLCKNNSLGEVLVLNKKYKLGIDSDYTGIFKDFNNYFQNNTEKILINMYVKYQIQKGGNPFTKAFKGISKTGKSSKKFLKSPKSLSPKSSSSGFLSGLFGKSNVPKSSNLLSNLSNKNSLMNMATSGFDMSSIKNSLNMGIQKSFSNMVPQIKNVLESFGPEIQNILKENMELIKQEIYNTVSQLIDEKMQVFINTLQEQILEKNNEQMLTLIKSLLESSQKEFLEELKVEITSLSNTSN